MIGRRRIFKFQGEREREKKVILDERLFRKVPMFSGDTSKCRGWYFDLMVVIGMADNKFAVEIKRFMKDMSVPGRLGENDNAENWTDLDDLNLDLTLYDKFSGELFGVLVQLIEGEAKATLKEMVDKGML